MPTLRDPDPTRTLHEPLLVPVPQMPAAPPRRALVALPSPLAATQRHLGSHRRADKPVGARWRPRLAADPLRPAAAAAEQRLTAQLLTGVVPGADRLAGPDLQRSHPTSLPLSAARRRASLTRPGETRASRLTVS